MEHIIRQTRFPQTKNQDLFDFKAILSPNKLLVVELYGIEAPRYSLEA